MKIYLITFISLILFSAGNLSAQTNQFDVRTGEKVSKALHSMRAFDLVVQNPYGDVSINESEGQEIQLRSSNSLIRDVKFSVIREKGSLQVIVDPLRVNEHLLKGVTEYEFTENSKLFDNFGRVNIELSVPFHLLKNLQINSLIGNISLDGAFDSQYEDDREIRLESMLGEIHCNECRAKELWLKSSYGDITLIESIGDTTIRSINGNLAINNSQGDLDVASVRGNIVSVGHKNGKMNLVSVDGDVTFDKSYIQYDVFISKNGKVSLAEPSPDKCSNSAK